MLLGIKCDIGAKDYACVYTFLLGEIESMSFYCECSSSQFKQLPNREIYVEGELSSKQT